MRIIAVTNLLTYAALAVMLVGCTSGGSGGDDDAASVISSEIETVPTVTTSVETGTAALLISQPVLTWEACATSERLECATLKVPMDYANLAGETISVAIARTRAEGITPERTLLMNPGGPGGPGIDFLSSIQRFGDMSGAMRETFRFVSFDPRGIGMSTPVNCDLTEIYTQDQYPVNREELAFNFNKTIQFAQTCSGDTGEYLQHLGSYNVVRDMNEMRKALGLTEIDFLGYSYGSRLAALYMQTYPESTGRFVLDGSMTPDPSLIPLVQGSLMPGQMNINNVARACVGVTVLCDTAEFSADLQARVDEIGAQPESQESALLFLILAHAATKPGFENVLIGGLSRYLETNDVAELQQIDTLLGISESAEDNDSNDTAFVAVMCADDAHRPTLDSIEALRAPFNVESDLFGEAFLSLAGLCAGWPEALDPIPQIATNQAPAALVIGGPTDAQTNLVFADQMATAIGGQFLRSEHEGHVTVFTGKNQCTQLVVEDFFLNGNLPSVAVCEADTIAKALAVNWIEDFPRM